MTTTFDWISSDRHLVAVVVSSNHTAPAHPASASHHSVNAAAAAAPAPRRPIGGTTVLQPPAEVASNVHGRTWFFSFHVSVGSEVAEEAGTRDGSSL